MSKRLLLAVRKSQHFEGQPEVSLKLAEIGRGKMPFFGQSRNWDKTFDKNRNFRNVFFLFDSLLANKGA